MMRHILFFSIALLFLTLPACRIGSHAGRPLEELSRPSGADEYVVSPGDTLNVTVWAEKNLSGEVFVREKDGKFTMALINDVPAAGKSLQAISKDITDRLAKFVPNASVSVSVVQSAPTRYYLNGAFAKPGEYRSDSGVTLLQAIATGGGFAPFADESSIILIRQTPEGEVRYRLDYNRIIDQKDPNPQLKNGDVISVE